MTYCLEELHPAELLNKYNFTRPQLCQLMGVSIDTMNSWLTRRRTPHKQTLRQAADIADRLENDPTFRVRVFGQAIA